MTAKKNERYEVVSNFRNYIEQGFEKKKKYMMDNYGIKYTKLSYFEEIAKYCGINSSTISQMHIRNLNTSYLVAIKISEFLEVPVTDIWEIVEIEKITSR